MGQHALELQLHVRRAPSKHVTTEMPWSPDVQVCSRGSERFAGITATQ